MREEARGSPACVQSSDGRRCLGPALGCFGGGRRLRNVHVDVFDGLYIGHSGKERNYVDD